MKALVLTFDKYRPFAEHMIICYEKLWPNNPFTFRVPYQSEEVKEHFEKTFGSKVEMIKSPSGIVDTMFALSDDLDENEWVYWCMDDRYPMKLNISEVEKCKRFIESENSAIPANPNTSPTSTAIRIFSAGFICLVGSVSRSVLRPEA